jgi:hypothetical protein
MVVVEGQKKDLHGKGDDILKNGLFQPEIALLTFSNGLPVFFFILRYHYRQKISRKK